MPNCNGKIQGAEITDQATISCASEADVAHVLNVVVAKGTPGPIGSYRLVGFEIAPGGPGCVVKLHFDPCGGTA